jgi:hypothetical protein
MFDRGIVSSRVTVTLRDFSCNSTEVVVTLWFHESYPHSHLAPRYNIMTE